MKVSLPFITKKKIKKRKKQIKKIIKIVNEHTPLEIMNMDMPELMYIYQHGTVAEKEIADNVLRARKKWEIASSLSDDVLPTGSPNVGAPTAYIVGQRGD